MRCLRDKMLHMQLIMPLGDAAPGWGGAAVGCAADAGGVGGHGAGGAAGESPGPSDDRDYSCSGDAAYARLTLRHKEGSP